LPEFRLSFFGRGRTFGAIAVKRLVLFIVLGLGPVLPAFADLSDVRPLSAISDAAKLAPVAWNLDRKAYSTVHFDFDRDFLDATAKIKLKRQAAFIMQYPGVRFAVTGHTDKVGNTAYNEALGMRRARRVVSYLVALGVDQGQLQAMVSFGEDRPVVDVDDRERRNRRVTTTVIIPKRTAKAEPATPHGGTGIVLTTPTPTSGTIPTPTGSDMTTSTLTTSNPKPRPGNSSYGTGKPDAGSGNGDEPSGDPAGSVGKNQGGDEKP